MNSIKAQLSVFDGTQIAYNFDIFGCLSATSGGLNQIR